MRLKEIVPWGRSFREYRDMFLLTDDDLQKTILGCGDGPAAFNAELTQAGGTVVSVDPVYRFTVDQIRSRVGEVYPEIMSEVLKNPDDYLWDSIRDVRHLAQVRMDAMEQFFDDCEQGKKAGRYINASLPQLPFKDSAFDLALCSHYLFLYSDHVSLEQHISSMKELCRVAYEVRIYPLVTLAGKRSPHLDPVVSELRNDGFEVSFHKAKYRFQRGAEEMVVVRRIGLEQRRTCTSYPAIV
ncbi:MAG: class I SAM-dependent methyltransferase [Chlorobium phaeobacteroides]|uniref:SAM-dependent methyltransferase n=1 Tax=Chlorobium phaeobacteroides (strain BS1) TaxID=331678 RepID=B3EKK2_CHLPB|nr:class I SAM-dependent methyltransferase [Chlorobium phaeobacteroides]NEX14592.1 class I SAM-dependent methyltransferase [Prosthecochloris sp.]